MSKSHSDGTSIPDTIIIGAGPSGLSAALELQAAGQSSIILEQGTEVGGLMRSPRWGDFILDLGRKELYARFPEIDDLWSQMLGDDYRDYPHRVGSLYQGRIVEMSGGYRGATRGMPVTWLATGGAAMLKGWIKGMVKQPETYQDFWYSRVGSKFAKLLAQGYWEKFRGARWADMPPPEADPTGNGTKSGRLASVKQAFTMARRGGVSKQLAWRHPYFGTGQLFEKLAATYDDKGGQIQFGATVTDLKPINGEQVLVRWIQDEVEHEATVRNVVSSMTIENLWGMLKKHADSDVQTPQPKPEADRSVLLVYLFLKAPHSFPHAWLEVNDPNLDCGRITNFGAFGGGMVPEGQGVYCVEYFCAANAPILQLSEEDQVKKAISELEGAGLVKSGDMLGSKVIHFPRTNAAASWREQQTNYRTAVFQEVKKFSSIYHVNRPGADWASLTGIQAARAISSQDRNGFDLIADPTIRQKDNIPTEATSSRV